MGFFSKTLDKLKGALKKTAAVLNTDVRTLFIPGRQIDDAFLAEMEEKFIRADMGVKNVTQMVAEVRDRWRLGKIKNADDAEAIVKRGDARRLGARGRARAEVRRERADGHSCRGRSTARARRPASPSSPGC